MNTDPRYIYWLIYICPFLKYGMEYGGARTMVYRYVAGVTHFRL